MWEWVNNHILMRCLVLFMLIWSGLFGVLFRGSFVMMDGLLYKVILGNPKILDYLSNIVGVNVVTKLLSDYRLFFSSAYCIV